jgi:undecaprenyl-diphosphatase
MEDTNQNRENRVFLINPHSTLNRNQSEPTNSALLLYALAILVFLVMCVFAHFHSHFAWDPPIQHIVRGIDLPYFADVMHIVSKIGNGRTPYFIAIATCVLFLFLRHWREAVGIMIATLGSGILNVLIKLLVVRPRPIDDPNMIFMSFDATSFPSGHVTFFVGYFGFLAIAANLRLPFSLRIRNVAVFLLAAPILLIGPSRVFLQAHYPSDVLGGYVLGALCLSATVWFCRKHAMASGKPSISEPLVQQN